MRLRLFKIVLIGSHPHCYPDLRVVVILRYLLAQTWVFINAKVRYLCPFLQRSPPPSVFGKLIFSFAMTGLGGPK